MSEEKSIEILEERKSYYDDHDNRVWGVIVENDAISHSDKNFIAYIESDDNIRIESLDEQLTDNEEKKVCKKIENEVIE